MCPVDKNQFSLISNQLFFEPARNQKEFLSQLKVKGLSAKKTQTKTRKVGTQEML